MYIHVYVFCKWVNDWSSFVLESESEVAQSFLTLCDPMDYTALRAPLSMGFSRRECWSGLLHPPPGDLLNRGIIPASLPSPALAGGFFTISATWDIFFIQSSTDRVRTWCFHVLAIINLREPVHNASSRSLYRFSVLLQTTFPLSTQVGNTPLLMVWFSHCTKRKNEEY